MMPADTRTTSIQNTRPRPRRLARSLVQAALTMPTSEITKISPTTVWLNP